MRILVRSATKVTRFAHTPRPQSSRPHLYTPLRKPRALARHRPPLHQAEPARTWPVGHRSSRCSVSPSCVSSESGCGGDMVTLASVRPRTGAPGSERTKQARSSSVLHDSKRRQTCVSPTCTQISDEPAAPSAGSAGTRSSHAARRRSSSASYAWPERLSALSSCCASFEAWYAVDARVVSSALLPSHSSAASRFCSTRWPWTFS
mmetsp:Transcript_55619/g.152972  ORF Transcript_55619/g.152972 Transcript_55619/m.152972 type:complete len:205 (+) Transcript_55619:227-841(+)